MGLSRELSARGVKNVVSLDLGPGCSWASYLVIGTVTSRVHMHGAAEAAAEALRGMGRDCGVGKRARESSWFIIDGGDVVVSLMDEDSRRFYALEERWYEAETIYSGEDAG